MRRYGRYGLAMVIIAFVAWLFVPVLLTRVHAWFRHLQAGDLHTLSIASTRSLVYPIKPKQWLTFALPEESQKLRIITNAHTRAAEAAALDPNRAYLLLYELLNKKGAVLAKGRYYQYSGLTPYKDSQGRLIYGNNYSDKDVVPLDGRLILLGLQAMKGAAFFRVSVETSNPSIFEVAVRVYVPTKIADHKIATSWLRMSQAEKDNLAKASVYSTPLLSAAEQSNLLKHQWQPLGPMGIEGKTYQTMTLYTVKDKVDAIQDTLMLASGLQADAQHYAVIPIKERGGLIRLMFKALDGSALTTPVVVNLRWFGRNKEQRWQQSAVWTKNSEGLDYQLDGGLLEIRPSSQVIVSAYLTTESEPKQDITDALLSIKSYRANVGINYNVLHYQQRPSALRIDVRRLLVTGIKPSQEPISYQWLNAKQKIIAKGELNALGQPSLFGRAGDITGMTSVSDPLSYYFNLPAEVTSLRLSANTPELLVIAYNQPYGLIKWQRIPEDAYIANDKQDHQLAWFPLRAVNDEKLMQQQAIQWLIGQYQLPEESADLLAGPYVWQDFIPQGDTAGRYLLTDYIGDEPRADASASIYCALTVNHEQKVLISAVKNMRSISPELIFLRDEARPFSAVLFLNQQKALDIKSFGQQGVINLPEMALGTQHITLNTDSGDGRWFMNHLANCKGQRYLKRRVFALDAATPLDFVVQHTPEDEVFSARLYSPANTVDRSQIKVTIDAIATLAPPAAVVSSWTYKNRLYDIRPLSAKAMPVLYAQGQSVTNGERFTISLNSDLPAGTYRIRLALAKGPSGYITLSQIKAGQHEQRRFYRESALETP